MQHKSKTSQNQNCTPTTLIVGFLSNYRKQARWDRHGMGDLSIDKTNQQAYLP
jgi:hypothetical protein